MNRKKYVKRKWQLYIIKQKSSKKEEATLKRKHRREKDHSATLCFVIYFRANSLGIEYFRADSPLF